MTSKAHANQSASGADIVKYAVALLLAVAGLAAFYVFADQWPVGIRILAVVAGLVAGATLFMATGLGMRTREFLSEARFELRKVVWPSRQETTRTMWVVIAVVIVISLALAGMDVIIQAGVKWLLGNG